MGKKLFILIGLFCLSYCTIAQLRLNWINVDSLFGPLPASIHVYKTVDSLDGKPNVAYYISADLKSKDLIFTTDTTSNRRLTPSAFYEKNGSPLVVVNATFFSFETHQNLNTVVKDGKVVGHAKAVPGRGNDTLLYHHSLNSVFGIRKNRKADIAWVFTDSNTKYPYAIQHPLKSIKSKQSLLSKEALLPFLIDPSYSEQKERLQKWKMHTAVGGGPVLLQNGNVQITNNEERKFGGKAIADKHPRTAIGYTTDNRLIILVIQGRTPGIAEGASLIQEAELLKAIGCREAMNLDGGGSSCLLVNGKETIAPSDKKQRAVPAVFIIKQKG